jgi:LysM repeat protein
MSISPSAAYIPMIGRPVPPPLGMPIDPYVPGEPGEPGGPDEPGGPGSPLLPGMPPEDMGIEPGTLPDPFGFGSTPSVSRPRTFPDRLPTIAPDVSGGGYMVQPDDLPRPTLARPSFRAPRTDCFPMPFPCPPSHHGAIGRPAHRHTPDCPPESKAPGKPKGPDAPPPVSQAPKAPKVHVVQPGDTLSAIGADHGFTWQEVHAANPQIKNPDLIFPGQHITIPAAPAEGAPPKATPPKGEAPKGDNRPPLPKDRDAAQRPPVGLPGQSPRQVPGKFPGQHPGQVPGQYPGQTGRAVPTPPFAL